MPGILTQFKLGRARNEIQFSASLEMPENLNVEDMSIRSKTESAGGELFVRVRRRNRPKYVLRFEKVSETFIAKLESLVSVSDAPLSLLWADLRNVISDKYILETATTFKLGSNPMTLLGRDYVAAGGLHNEIIVPASVFTTYDPAGAQGGTNYFVAGSYNATTRTVTLGSSPGGAGTVVYCNWRYYGSLVLLEKMTPSHAGGAIESGLPLWDVTLNLEGV